MRTLYVRRVPTPIYRALERRARERGSSVSAETIRLLGRALRADRRSEEHTSELQSRLHLVCRLLLEKKNTPPLEYLSSSRTRPRLPLISTRSTPLRTETTLSTPRVRHAAHAAR